MEAAVGCVISLHPKRTAALINTVFRDYPVLINETETGFMNRCRSNDIDISRSPVLFVDGEPAGLALLAVRGEEGWLGGMGVKREHRKKGLGKRILEEAISQARECGIENLTLEVMEQNIPAIELYKKTGFMEKRKLYCFKTTHKDTRESFRQENGEILEAVEGVPIDDLGDVYDRRNCWQKSLASLSRVEGLEAYTFKHGSDYIYHGYVVLSRRNQRAEIMDVNPPEALGAVLRTFCSNTYEARAINIHNPILAKQYLENGFEEFLRQREMVLRVCR